jgi:hypothetical protein
MKKDDQQLFKPSTLYADTQANIEALTGINEGAIAFAQDKDQIVTYNGISWYRAGANQSFTPTLEQNGSVSATVDYAQYATIGNITFMTGKLTSTGTGNSGYAIEVHGLPNTPSYGAGGAIGGGFILDNGTAWYTVIVRYNDIIDCLIFVGYNTGGMVGESPSFALASGDVVSFNCWYIT